MCHRSSHRASHVRVDGGRAAGVAAACLALLLLEWRASPVAAAPLLYLSSGQSLQVIDADTGQLRKVLALPAGTSVFAQPIEAGGRLCVLSQSFPQFALLVVDPERNVLAGSIAIAVPEALMR